MTYPIQPGLWLNCNSLSELVANSYIGDIVYRINFMPFSEDITLTFLFFNAVSADKESAKIMKLLLEVLLIMSLLCQVLN